MINPIRLQRLSLFGRFQRITHLVLFVIGITLKVHTPDSVIAPWLESVQPDTLWVIGETTPPVVTDYQQHSSNLVSTMSHQEVGSTRQPPQAALIAKPLISMDQLLVAGQLRNLLISDILCFVHVSIPQDSLYALAFKRGEESGKKGMLY